MMAYALKQAGMSQKHAKSGTFWDIWDIETCARVSRAAFTAQNHANSRIVNTGNELTGDFDSTDNQTNVTTLVQTGQNANGTLSLKEYQIDSPTIEKWGNIVDGMQTISETGQDINAFFDTNVSPTGDSVRFANYEDIDDYTIIGTDNANTGDSTRVRVGDDGYEMEEEFSSASPTSPAMRSTLRQQTATAKPAPLRRPPPAAATTTTSPTAPAARPATPPSAHRDSKFARRERLNFDNGDHPLRCLRQLPDQLLPRRLIQQHQRRRQRNARICGFLADRTAGNGNAPERAGGYFFERRK